MGNGGAQGRMLADESNGAYPVLHEAGLRYDRVRADIVRAVGDNTRILTDGDVSTRWDADRLHALGRRIA